MAEARFPAGGTSEVMMIGGIKELYFSRHHLIRDLVGNVAPLSAFLLVYSIFDHNAQRLAKEIFTSYIINMSFWAFILCASTYVLSGYFIGSLANFGGNFINRMLRYVPRFGEKCSYPYWYKKDAKDIDDLYLKIFPDHQYLSSGAAVSPTDKVNALKEYFRRYNPDGYSETYRQYIKIDIVRAAMLYPIIYLAVQFILALRDFGSWSSSYNGWLISISFLSLGVAFVELPRRIQKFVRTEYFFIIASARFKEDSDTLPA
jgi:hypothetical protein